MQVLEGAVLQGDKGRSQCRLVGCLKEPGGSVSVVLMSKPEAHSKQRRILEFSCHKRGGFRFKSFILCTLF